MCAYINMSFFVSVAEYCGDICLVGRSPTFAFWPGIKPIHGFVSI